MIKMQLREAARAQKMGFIRSAREQIGRKNVMVMVKDISEAELQDAHLHFQKSPAEIAVEHDTTEYSIRKLMKHYKIPITEHETELKPKVAPSNRFKKVKPIPKSRHKNAVLFHSNKETWKHWICKCVLAKVLRDEGHQIFTEMPMGNAEVDILDATASASYELESNPGSQTFQKKLKKLDGHKYDLIIIDLRKVPDDLEGMIRYFKKF